MTILRALVFAILAGIALSLGSVAHAGAIYDNLSATSSYYDPVANYDPSNNDAGFGPLADSFTNGSTATLIDVKFLLSGDPTSGSSTSVDLLSDSSTSPGSVLAHLGTISDSSLSSSPGVIDVSGFAPVVLSANTRYWIQLSSPDTSAVWYYSYDTSGPGVAGEYFYGGLGVFPNSDGPFQMQVNVVPEPSSVTLGLFGIGTFAVFLRRRAR
jgi:hypothetical protein